MYQVREAEVRSILSRIEDYGNAYVLQLLDDWNISHTFNMIDLFEYHPDVEEMYEPNSRMNSFRSEGDQCRMIARKTKYNPEGII